MKSLNDMLLKHITSTILIISGLIWACIAVFDVNPVNIIANAVNFTKLPRIIYGLFGLATIIYIAKFYNKSILIPHFSETIFPISLIQLSKPNNCDTEMTFKSPNGSTHLVYWAALPKNQLEGVVDYTQAYGDYSNSGCVAVENGQATACFNKPSTYKPYGSKAHLHIRWVFPNGTLSKVETIDV